MTSPRIAIIGAGPSGLLLARLLSLSPSPIPLNVQIFERDASPSTRTQGGTLDLRSGLPALKAAGLEEKFFEHARWEGSALGICDKRGKWLLKVGGGEGKGGNPEIDREALRKLLLDSLPEGCVQWGKQLLRISDDKTLYFSDGMKEKFDLVVGAEGAWSKVRELLTPSTPYYTGIHGYSLSIPSADTTAPSVSALVNHGSVFAFGDGKSIVAQQMGDGSVDVSVWMVSATEPEREEESVTQEGILERFADWDEVLKDIVRKTSGEVTRRSLFMLEVGLKWEGRSGVTLVGDAAHLMTPFGGEGVNIAFVDAWKLSIAIIDAVKSGWQENLDTKVAEYENNMFVRAKEVTEMTDGMMKDMYFTPGAPRSSIARWALRKIRLHVSPYLFPFIAVALHIYVFFAKLFI